MSGQYLGHLPERDPLYCYLRHDIQPQLTGWRDRVKYRVFRLNGSNDVYLYEEKYTGSRVIGKFFWSQREQRPEVAGKRLGREFHHLEMMRGCGFTGYPHYIARPLGCNGSLNQLLVLEYCHGEALSSIIRRSIRERNDGLLFDKLRALAYFLATFHNRTANGYGVDFHQSCAYFDSLAWRLREGGTVGAGEAAELSVLRDFWREDGVMWEDQQVLVHGDATPENFLLGDGLWVISFDLERLRRADRAFDVGRIAGELAHFFLDETGNRYLAEPFIGHFLWEYACHFPNRDRAFASITGRIPFYLGMTLLRIARNGWLAREYRRRLVHEGMECLRRGRR